MNYQAETIDIAVIGAGHAGVEAALAAARLGMNTILFTLSLDAVANLPCNPSIGGTAKGHLVREIDALGGEMGKAADSTLIQSRMLNRGKGPAVHSLRAQVDRKSYHSYIKAVLENQPNLKLKQSEVTEISLDSHGKVSAIVTDMGAVYNTKAVIIASGTYLGGRVFVGDYSRQSGPDGLQSANSLIKSLEKLGINLRRFKTGTPARVERNSIDFTKLAPQPGDEAIVPFSFATKTELSNKVLCHIAYTNENTHEIIRQNLNRSPMYSGKIKATGTRYCPSIEDKIVRFADKLRHQIFIEPMGLDTSEMYLQGLSSSLPEEVQIELYRSIIGLENAHIMRSAYAIEYECIDPTQLLSSLEFVKISGLYGAGQFNGTSGYEEAAAQGLVAGINAARSIKGLAPIDLPRQGSYIGTLIDDLVTKGCTDPYRMMTSRCEYRLILRQDNADLRLTPLGKEIGLISPKRYDSFLEKKGKIYAELKRVEGVNLPPSQKLDNLLEQLNTPPQKDGIKLIQLLRRPQISYEMLSPLDPSRTALPEDVCEQVEIQIKYEGYIKKQFAQAAQFEKLEKNLIPAGVNYLELTGLRLEAREKLDKIRPQSIGQASRISGVTPSDIAVLLISLSKGEVHSTKEEKDE